MPKCDSHHLVRYLYEIGPTLGNEPVTHSEIESWQRNTGIELDSWQARTLRRLSGEYLGTYRKACDPDFAAPWAADYVQAVPSVKVETMRDAIRGLANL